MNVLCATALAISLVLQMRRPCAVRPALLSVSPNRTLSVSPDRTLKRRPAAPSAAAPRALCVVPTRTLNVSPNRTLSVRPNRTLNVSPNRTLSVVPTAPLSQPQPHPQRQPNRIESPLRVMHETDCCLFAGGSIVAVAAVLALLPVAPQAQSRRAMTIEDLIVAPRMVDPQLLARRPHGALRQTTTDGKTGRRNADIYSVAADGTGQPKAVIDGEKSENTPRWSPDGKRIAFLANRDGAPRSTSPTPMAATSRS